MEKMKAAMIGFLPKDGGDPYEALKGYAGIGYTAFEGGGLLLKDGDPAENLKKVQEFGLKPLSISCGADNIPEDPTELIGKARSIGVDKIICYCGCAGAHRFGGRDTRPDYDEIMAEIEKFEAFAQKLQKEGMTFLYHNHDVEFNYVYNGASAFSLMVANSDTMKFELDVGWVTYSGHNPVRVINDLGSRLGGILHVKDFVPGEVQQGNHTMPNFTTPGTGLLNLKGCLEAAQGLGIEYASVEQDFQRNLTCHETLTAAYLNMKETGFVC